MTNTYNAALAQIGRRIYQRREELGLSGAELAIRVNMSASRLSNIENGQRNIGITSICAIAQALEVPLSRIQPDELDVFLKGKSEMNDLISKMDMLSVEQKEMMLTMFNAQIDVLLDISDAKNYHI